MNIKRKRIKKELKPSVSRFFPLPGYDAFMLRLFLRAQYKANIAPLINDITRMANAIPDIHVVAHVPMAGSDLKFGK